MPNVSRIFHLVADPVAVLAHQGGWDEFLLVAGPIVVIVAVLAVAKRRVDAYERELPEPLATDTAPADPEPTDPEPADPSLAAPAADTSGSEPAGDDR